MESLNNSTIVLKINISPRKFFVIIGSYREWKHPGGADALSTEGIKNQVTRLNELGSVISKVKSMGYPVIWAGDLNIDRLHKNDSSKRADLRVLTPIFDSFINDYDLVQFNKDATWFRPGKKPSLLDLFLLDNPQQVVSCSNVTNILSEHAGVLLTINIDLKHRKPQFITIRNYKNITWEKIEPLLDKENSLQDLFNEKDPDIIAVKLLAGLNKIVSTLAPKKRIQLKKSSTPYWNQELSDSLSEVKEMMRIARESGSYDDERAAKHKRNQHSRRIKQRIKTYYKEKFRNNLKQFKTLKELDDEQARGPTTIIKDGEEISSPKRIAEEMSRGFVEKVQRIRNKINGNRYEAIRSYKNAIPRNENDFKLEIVSVEQVYNIINNMKTSNSRGNDELTSRIIKQMPSYVATATCHLFNSIVRLAKFPEALKTARLTPILKPGKTSTNIESYRPISNLNIVEKVIEEVIRSQLEKFLTKTKVITPNHHGGRKNH